MKYITKLRLKNFKRFGNFECVFHNGRNIFIGDNEAGKSTILEAIDIVLSGNRSRIETIGLESLFNKQAVENFLTGNKNIASLPALIIEVFLNDHHDQNLEGMNNSEGALHHGLKLMCEPMDEYSQEINEALNHADPLFPFEYYRLQFSTFAAQSYTQNRRFLKHILIDSSLIGNDYATKYYTKSLYEVHTDLPQRHANHHAYRQSKSNFTRNNLTALNQVLQGTKFELRNDSKSNIEQDLMITEGGIPIFQMGKGSQCFIKTEFALLRHNAASSIDLVLIEEPENHLSHLKMQKLINKIEEATQTQIMVATHSNSICSRLDLHNAHLLSDKSPNPISLKKLPNGTVNYFIKAPNNKILEFALSPKVILVEGDAEFILMSAIYKKLFNDEASNSGIHIISVGGTSFKRYMDLAMLLGIKTAVIRDNDGNINDNCVENYKDYSVGHIKVFFDEEERRKTLEICVYEDNSQLCEDLFKEGRRTITVLEYMLANKSDAALKILEEGIDRFVIPPYIESALQWIRE